jgi:RNA polymerase sigma-70 factor (ECF subfamily)
MRWVRPCLHGNGVQGIFLTTKRPTAPPPDGVRDCEAARELELALIRRAAEGDARAARTLVEAHHGGMYNLALRMVGDGAEAEDLVQEAFARAFHRLDQFDDTYRLSTWLHRIVLNSCRDHLKSPRRRERPSSAPLELAPEVGASQSDALIDDQRARRLHSALQELRPKYREIIVLKDVLGLSYDEIRDVTGTPITGLKVRAIRARARLRKLLEEKL